MAETVASILEAAMVICFGASWPLSIRKSLKTKFVRGKSLEFMLLILLGYACGVAFKIIKFHEWVQNGDDLIEKGWNAPFYLLNLLLVTFDICLYIKYRHNDSPVAPPETVV